MAKPRTQKRVTARTKSSKRGKKSVKPLLTKAAKRATPKKARSKSRGTSVSTAKPVAEHRTKVTYEIVQHDEGWAYRIGGAFSETFSSHDEARAAAERAASEQLLPGETTAISWEDKDGRWHDEVSPGDDRPQTDVEG